MDFQFWGYLLLFVVIGVPLIGYVVRTVIRAGKYLYRNFPFIKRFFDEYYEHFALGTIVTIVVGIVYCIGHYWMKVI